MSIRLESLPADILGLSELARTALSTGLAGELRVARNVGDIPEPADSLTVRDRDDLVQGLTANLEEFGPPARVQTSLNLLAEPGTAVVITGQQAGFLGGPLYTLYKAMQTCRLATELSAAWGRPVVPVFWNHGDDHDFGEVSHAWLLNRNQDLQKLSLPGGGGSRTPIGELTLGDEQHRLPALRAAVGQAFEEHEHTEWALEQFFPREGETLVRALTRALTTVLGTHGLVVLEPSAVRNSLSRSLARAVGAGACSSLLPGAIDPASAALLFRHVEGQRTALRLSNEGFQQEGRPGAYGSDELAACILERPGEWSAGALLRPLVQDLTLPVAATVGGWGELAYHSQLTAARRTCDAPTPPFVPRVSVTLVDAGVEDALAKLETSVRAILEARGEWRPAEESGEEPKVLSVLRARETEVREELLALRGALRELEPALESSLKRTADILAKELGKLRTKVERVHRNQRGTGDKHLRRINHALCPRGGAQERCLTAFQFLAVHGTGLVEGLYEELPALASEHLIAHLPDPAES